MSEAPFSIAIPDEKLDELRRKLDLTVFPDELDEAGWKYGAPLSDIKRLVARWKDGSGYSWRKHEAELNEELPMFTRDIQVDGFGSLNIHYVHKKSEVENAVPLLFVHGWPGSFIEVRKIAPLFTAASHEHPSFHLVALSLPGFGFSEAPHKQGFGLAEYTEVGHKLMLALGYSEYVAHGGDWGMVISRNIATTYGGTHVKAWHTNFPIAPAPHPLKDPVGCLSYLFTIFRAEERAGLARTLKISRKGMGYYHQQSTQPQRLGYALADSPVGLLAWIYDKIHRGTDGYPWEDDEVLIWVSIYWFSRAGPAASLRIYFEIPKSNFSSPASFPTIPAGFSYFPKEIVVLPSAWIRRVYNVVFESSHSSGGHFAAYEAPCELVGDIRKMFGKGGPAHGVVHGKCGYARRCCGSPLGSPL